MQFDLHLPLCIFFPELGSENMRTVLYIVVSYVYLAPAEFPAAMGAQIAEKLQVRINEKIRLPSPPPSQASRENLN